MESWLVEQKKTRYKRFRILPGDNIALNTEDI